MGSSNFIDLFESMSQYNFTLRQHTKGSNDKHLYNIIQIHDILNELISLISKPVLME